MRIAKCVSVLVSDAEMLVTGIWRLGGEVENFFLAFDIDWFLKHYKREFVRIEAYNYRVERIDSNFSLNYAFKQIKKFLRGRGGF